MNGIETLSTIVAEQKRPLSKLCPRCHGENKLDASTTPFHVFINHRGVDVKKTLASHLYNWFDRTGLNVFLDKPELEPGQELHPAISEAIRTSSVHIAILSQRYAESHWCLEELCQMVESGARIIPVFYGVTHGELMQLQKNGGGYAKSFLELAKKTDGDGKARHNPEKLQRWRDGIKEVCKISGLDVSKFNGDEGELVRTIVGLVKEHVRKERTNAVEKMVGLQERLEDFKNFLKNSRKGGQNDVDIVGIVGAAGSGKTTVAEEYYYQQLGNFDRYCLLFGVKKAYERNGLPVLQKQLLKELTCDRMEEINNISHGREILVDRVKRLSHKRSLKFLIVIDDVDNREQLDALLLKEEVLGPGSLVIVTSIDKAILKLSGIFLHYEIRPLGMQDAQELLCRSAFHHTTPIPEDLVKTAINKCDGLPKALQVIGGNLHLYGTNNKDYWEDEMAMIFDIPDIIRDSYGVLGEEEKQIFLDIACFFVGMEKNSAIRIWGGSDSEWSGARALKRLEYLCLVQIDENNQLKMRNYLRDLGRHIAGRQLQNCLDLPFRLWHPNVATKFLDGLLPSLPERTIIRGIMETSRRYNQRCGRKKLKTCMSPPSVKIELLDVEGDLPCATFSNGLLDLIWFRWKCCPRTSIPCFEMGNLRVLELVQGSLDKLWDSAEPPLELRELNVMECKQFAEIPSTIGCLKHLEKMTVNGTIRLQSLPQEFCELKALKHLELSQCEGLTSLPDHFGELTNLQHIDLSHCRNLSRLPNSFGQLIQLKFLDLGSCRNLEIEPNIFSDITTIEELNFQDCQKLVNIPNHLVCQRSMRKLILLGTSLGELPENIEQLRKLEYLTIESPSLRSIPASLGNLPCLRFLMLYNCPQVNEYPQSIGQLALLPTQNEGAIEDNPCRVYRSQSRQGI